MMKKILAGLIASLMGVFAVGCRNHNADSESGKEETQDKAAETTAADEDAAVTSAVTGKKENAEVTAAATGKIKDGETGEKAVPYDPDEPDDLDKAEELQEAVTETPVTEKADDGEQHFDKEGSEMLE